jgi:Tol biopolymer transport system component
MRLFIPRLALILALICVLLVEGTKALGRARGIGLVAFTEYCVIYLVDASSHELTIWPFPYCARFPAWSWDGEWLAVEVNEDDILVARASAGVITSQPRLLTSRDAAEQSPALSPDGSQLAFWTIEPDRETLTVIEVESGELRIFRDFSVIRLHSALAWSPDGSQIAFASNHDGDEEIYLLDVNTSEVRQLTSNNFRDDAPAWSPDGQQIVFTSAEDGYNELHIVNVTTGERYQLTRGVIGYVPSWSPDGKYIAFMSNRDMRNELYVINADGSNLRRLTYIQSNEGLNPVWVP